MISLIEFSMLPAARTLSANITLRLFYAAVIHLSCKLLLCLPGCVPFFCTFVPSLPLKTSQFTCCCFSVSVSAASGQATYPTLAMALQCCCPQSGTPPRSRTSPAWCSGVILNKNSLFCGGAYGAAAAAASMQGAGLPRVRCTQAYNAARYSSRRSSPSSSNASFSAD
jgi:hypothetical protein